eukprot:47097-Pleurochrysis_carterae.AAC.1
MRLGSDGTAVRTSGAGGRRGGTGRGGATHLGCEATRGPRGRRGPRTEAQAAPQAPSRRDGSRGPEPRGHEGRWVGGATAGHVRAAMHTAVTRRPTVAGLVVRTGGRGGGSRCPGAPQAY